MIINTKASYRSIAVSAAVMTAVCLIFAFIVSVHPAYAEGEETHTHDDGTVFTAWDSANGLPEESGNYYLTRDVTISDTWTINNGTDIHLCLNGHTIYYTGENGDTAILINKKSDETGDAVFTLDDCSTGNTGTITAEKGFAVRVGNDNETSIGNFIMNGGTISGGVRTAVVVKWGDFTMNGGSISNNHDPGNCGGVYVGGSGQNSHFTMNGGTIANNSSEGCCGGVYIGGKPGNTFSMSSGIISGNVSKKPSKGSSAIGNVYGSGAGVFAINANVIMTGGSITENRDAAGYAGGICMVDGKLWFDGGEISNNTGRGVLLNRNSHMYLGGGSITGNTQTASGDFPGGGGVYAYTTFLYASGEPKSAVIIENNTYDGCTGNLYMRQADDQHLHYVRFDGNTGLDAGSRIGITTEEKPTSSKSVKFTREMGEKAGKYNFFSDNPEYVVDETGSGSSKEAVLKFDPLVVNVTYDSNGGSGEMEGGTAAYNQDFTFPECGFTAPAGYVFDKWIIGEDSYEAGQTYKLKLTEGTAIKAGWKPIVYSLSYDLAGGAYEGAEPPAAYTVESEDITLPRPVRAAYDFVGWTGTDASEPVDDLTIPKGSIGNRSYKAVWTPTVYKLTYRLNGGSYFSGQSNPATYTVEDDTITLVNPVQTGQIFAGWYLRGSSDPESREMTIPAGSTGDREFIAMWDDAAGANEVVALKVPSQYGTLAVDKAAAAEGEAVTVTVKAAGVYSPKVYVKAVDGSTVTEVKLTGSENGFTGSFTMPAYPVAVEADFTGAGGDGDDVRPYVPDGSDNNGASGDGAAGKIDKSEQKEKTSGSGTRNRGVKTGDDQNVRGWISMMIASVLALAAIVIKRRDILHR